MSQRRLPEVRFVRTVCPRCGGTDNRVATSRQSGCVIVRYHECACVPGEYAFRSFEVVEIGRRKAKVPRKR